MYEYFKSVNIECFQQEFIDHNFTYSFILIGNNCLFQQVKVWISHILKSTS